MAHKDAAGVPDTMDEFFDDEQELMAAAQGASKDDVDASAEEVEAPADEAPAEEAPVEKKKSKQAKRSKASDASGDRQAPPFWMVLAIAGVSLALGIVIGYLTGSASAYYQMGATSDQVTATDTDDAVQMPEGHPDVTVDEDGNATVSEDGSSSSDASDPLTLANNYFDMGMAAMQSATDEESQAKAAELFNQAVAYYDEYLSSTSSASATVDRAICVFYGGDHEGAIADLEAFVEQDSTFAPAWANLGMFYESHDEQDKAKNAYEQALAAAEQEDTYGVKDYAQQRLDALNNQ